MNRAFRLKAVYRRLMILGGGFFILVGLSFLLFLLAETRELWAVSVLFLFFAGIGAMLIRGALRWRLEVDDWGIRRRSWLGERYFAFDEISGFRRGDKGSLIIRHTRRGVRPLTIPLQSIDGEKELFDWLSYKATDLDKAEYEAEQTALLADERHGVDEAARLASYRRYKRAATALTISAAIVLGFSVISALRTSDKIMYPAALLPLIGCGLLVWSKGFIGLDAKKNSDRPALFFALLLATVSVVAVGCFSHTLIDWPPLFPWIGGIAALYFLPYLIVCLRYRPYNKKLVPGGVLIALVMAGCCGLGLARYFNFSLDEGALTPYRATVTRHWETTGKGDHYHIEFEAVGPLRSPQQQGISRKAYDRLQVGSKVLVITGQGKLGAAWYVMNDE